MITTILFDLDGTLVPMDQDKFVEEYMGRIGKYMVQHGYDPKQLVSAIWKGTGLMVMNDGARSNEEVFWEYAKVVLGEKVLSDKSHFDEFYENEFDKVRAVCGYNPKAAETVRTLKEEGYRLVLATNPIFPRRATQWRMDWAGLSPEDFELYTTYENCSYSKPNLKYYQEILRQINASPEECLMVGNDVRDDMGVTEMGMKVFLMTDDLINKDNADISIYPNGTFSDLMEYIHSLR